MHLLNVSIAIDILNGRPFGWLGESLLLDMSQMEKNYPTLRRLPVDCQTWKYGVITERKIGRVLMLKDFVKRDLTALEEKIGREKEQQDAFMEESGLEGADVNYLRKQFLSAEEAAEAKAEELEDIRVRKSRKTDWDEYVDAPRRWGRAMHHSDLIYNLRRLIPNLYVIDGMVRNTLGLYVWDRNKKFQADPRAAVKVGGTVYLGWIHYGWNPEYEIDLVNDIGVAV